MLAKAVPRGGNTLMNVGPMGDGRIDPKDMAILNGIGDWWRVNGESVQGCDRTPLAVQTWGESTRKGNRLYLHVFDWPSDRKLVVGGLKSRVRSPRLLADSGDTIGYKLRARALNDSDVIIEGLPLRARDQADSVISLEVVGEMVADASRLLQPEYGAETLRVFDAELHGKGLKFGPGKVRDAHVTGWTKAGQSIVWPVRLNTAAEYDVAIIYDAEENAVGATYQLGFGSQTLNGTVKPGAIQTASLGRVSLPPGIFTITLSTTDNRNNELMRPRSILLKVRPI
jgi:hypothetical protein